MTRDDIIAHIINDPEYKSICQKITESSHLHGLTEDLYHELLLVLLEYEPAELEKIYNMTEGSLFRFFVIRIAVNMVRNKRHPFYKTYVGPRTLDDAWALNNLRCEEDEMMVARREENAQQFYSRVLAELAEARRDYKGNFPFDVRVLEAYAHYGSLHRISRITGIPYTCVQESISRIRKRIQKHVDPSHFID